MIGSRRAVLIRALVFGHDVVVAGLAVRAWAAADAAATPAGPTTTQGFADRGFTDQG